MKIALAVDTFPSRSGVTGSWPSQIADRLRRSHEVHVLAREFPAAKPMAIVAHRINMARRCQDGDALVEASLRSLGADIVHGMGLGRYADVLTPLGTPAAMEDAARPAAASWPARWLKRLARRLFASGDQASGLAVRRPLDARILVAAPSAMTADPCKSLGVLPERCHVVYPGVDIMRFSPHVRVLRRDATRRRLGVDPNELLLLWVGQDAQRKGLDTALRAVGHLAAERRQVRLAAVGGPDCQAYDKLARRLGLADRVVFIGQADPIPYYAAADAFLLPSRYDPFSITLLEAAACGLPSIASKSDGAGELLSDGIDGYLLDAADDDRQLAARAVDLLDPVRRERMGRAARRMAIGHTIDRAMDQILRLYETVLSERLAAGAREPQGFPQPAGERRAPARQSRRAA